jgi:DNA primase
MQYELINLLDTILGSHQRQGQTEVYWPCPFCHSTKPKLAINLNKGAWHCWVCAASGKRLLSLLRKLDCSTQQVVELSNILKEEIPYVNSDIVTSILNLPMEYEPLYEPSKLIVYKHALKYVVDRGITAADILKHQIGYCANGEYANRIIIPSYDINNKLNYFVGRSFYESTMKYKNPKISKNIIGFENMLNWNYPIVLCEGVYDAMAIKRNAVPLLGKSIPTKLHEQIIKHDVRDIYIALDTDAIRQVVRTAEYFMNEGRNVFIVSTDEKDPSEIGFSKMNTLIKEAQLLTFSQLIKLKVTG